MSAVIGFGKHMGTPVEELPIGYALWLAGQGWLPRTDPVVYEAVRRRAVDHFMAEIEAERVAGC